MTRHLCFDYSFWNRYVAKLVVVYCIYQSEHSMSIYACVIMETRSKVAVNMYCTTSTWMTRAIRNSTVVEMERTTCGNIISLCEPSLETADSGVRAVVHQPHLWGQCIRHCQMSREKKVREKLCCKSKWRTCITVLRRSGGVIGRHEAEGNSNLRHNGRKHQTRKKRD